MATSETEFYNRLDLIVSRVGTATARRLFEKCVLDLKPEREDGDTWTVDKFMNSNKRKIMQLRPNNTIKFHLYPDPPKARDYRKWDIVTLLFVLTRICGLDGTLCSALATFKSIRNTLAHLKDPAVKRVTYQKKLDDLKLNHDLCLRAIGDTTFEADQKNLLYELEHKALSVSDMTKFYHEKMKEQNELKSVLTKQQKDVSTILRKMDQLLTRTGKDFPPATEHRDTDDDILQQFDVELKLLFSECDIEKAEQSLLDSLKRRIAETPDISPPHLTGLDKAVDLAFEDFKRSNYKIVYADEGCIGLQIRCKSPRGLPNFFRDYFEGKLQSLFEPVKAALQIIPGLENMSLDVVIYEDEFKRVMDNMVTFLSSGLPGAEESIVNETNSIVIQDDLHSPTVVEDESPDLYRRVMFLSSGTPEMEESNVNETNSTVIENDHQGQTVVEDMSLELYTNVTLSSGMSEASLFYRNQTTSPIISAGYTEIEQVVEDEDLELNIRDLPEVEISYVGELHSIMQADETRIQAIYQDEGLELDRRENLTDPDLPLHEHSDEDKEQTHTKSKDSRNDSSPTF